MLLSGLRCFQDEKWWVQFFTSSPLLRSAFSHVIRKMPPFPNIKVLLMYNVVVVPIQFLQQEENVEYLSSYGGCNHDNFELRFTYIHFIFIFAILDSYISTEYLVAIIIFIMNGQNKILLLWLRYFPQLLGDDYSLPRVNMKLFSLKTLPIIELFVDSNQIYCYKILFLNLYILHIQYTHEHTQYPTLYRLFISGILDCLYFYVSFIVAVEKSPKHKCSLCSIQCRVMTTLS